MSEPDQSLTPAEHAEALASAESVQEIYAALAPEVLDADLEAPVEVVGDDVLNRQVVHAVLVAHDGSRWLPRTLDSLSHLTLAPATVTAVDTGSKDSTPDLLAQSPLVTSVTTLPREAAFTSAVAHAVAQVPVAGSSPEPGGDAEAGAEWLWLLHDDCAPHPDCLRRLLAMAIEHDAAVVGPKVLDWEGRRRLVEMGLTITGSGRRHTGLERDERDQGQHDDRLDVLAVGTAGMLVRRDVWQSLGGLDPQIEMFRDDVDFGWRARLAGHRVVVAPRALLEHAAAASHGRRRLSMTRERAPLVDRRNAVHVLVANAGRWAFVPAVLRVVVGSLLRSVGFVLGKVPGLAWDEASAVSGALRPGRLRQARRWRARLPRTGSAAGLRPTLGTQLRQAFDNASGLLAGTGAGEDVRAARRRVLDVDLGEDEVEEPFEPVSLLTRASGLPGLWLVAVATLLTLVSARTVLFGGRLSGGALLPAPDQAGAWWSAYLASWHPVGLGSGVGAPPYLPVLSGVSVPLFGQSSAVVTLLVLGSVPLATASAWWALRAVTASLWVRLWGAVTYAVVVLGTGAVAAGRLGTCVAAVLVPLLGRAVVAALRPQAPLRRAWGAALLLALTAAFAPVTWPVVAVAAALGAVTLSRSLGSLLRWLVVVAVPAALLAPWLPQLAARPELLVSEPGLTGRGGELSDPALPSWYPALLAPGGPGSLPVGVLAALPVLALLGLLVTRSVSVRLGWVVGLTAIAAGVLTARVAVSTPLGQGSAAGWPGPAVVLAGAGLVVAVVVGIGPTARRAGRVVGAALVVLAVATTGVGATLGLVSSTVDPLERTDPTLLPVYVAEEAAGPDRVRTLVLRAEGAEQTRSLRYTVLRQDGARLGDAEVADPDEAVLLADVVADVLAGRGAASTGRLGAFGIRYVYVPEPADGGLIDALDGQAGLSRASAPDGGAIWRVDGTTARVRLLTAEQTSDEPVGQAVPSGRVEVSTTIDSPDASQLVLAELDDAGWTATLDGEPLSRTTHGGGLVAFDLPSGTGELVVVHGDPQRRWLLVAQAVALGVTLVLMVPSLAGRRESLEESLL
jgi:GT2 family glycosyltransferase